MRFETIAFEAKLAGMGEDGWAVALDMLVEPDAGSDLGHIDANVALRTSSGSRRRSSPFKSMRSKALARWCLATETAHAP